MLAIFLDCFEAHILLALVNLEFTAKDLSLSGSQDLSKNTECQEIFQEVI